MPRATALSLCLPALLWGCAPRTSQFQIIDHRKAGGAQRYEERFDEGYYSIDGSGNVDVVLRRVQPGTDDPDQEIVQIIHLRTVWRAVPGNTVAESTQINGTVSYLMLYGDTGAAFEGAGSIFFTQDGNEEVLWGALEQAILKPTRRLATGSDLFERAQLSGEFRAERDPRQVRRIINEMNQRFGPLPRTPPRGIGPR